MLPSALLLFATSASALSFPDVSGILPLLTKRSAELTARQKAAACPAIWTQVSKDLTAKFLSGGQCNQDARAAIRLIFHDCGGEST